MGFELDREKLIRLFNEVSQELRVEGARAQIYIVGGAAMSMAFDRERTTKDVDGRIEIGHGALTKAVQNVARRHDLPDNWVNESATILMPRAGDVRAKTVYESANLTVTGASAKHLLAMKLSAGREKDFRDVAVLCEELQLQDVDEAVAIYRELFPGEKLKGTARTALDETFRDRSIGWER